MIEPMSHRALRAAARTSAAQMKLRRAPGLAHRAAGPHIGVSAIISFVMIATGISLATWSMNEGGQRSAPHDRVAYQSSPRIAPGEIRARPDS